MKVRILLAALVVLTMPTGITAQEARGLKNAVILVIRHAEDAARGDGISQTGVARAKAYVDYLRTIRVDGRSVEPNFLFAARDTVRSRRPRLTLEPAAQAFNLNIDGRFRTGEVSELVHQIETLPAGGNIVICWRHGEIPNLLRMLGADPRSVLPKGKWPGGVFGWLVLLRYDDKSRLFDARLIKENFVPGDVRSEVLAPRAASGSTHLQ